MSESKYDLKAVLKVLGYEEGSKQADAVSRLFELIATFADIESDDSQTSASVHRIDRGLDGNVLGRDFVRAAQAADPQIWRNYFLAQMLLIQNRIGVIAFGSGNDDAVKAAVFVRGVLEDVRNTLELSSYPTRTLKPSDGGDGSEPSDFDPNK